MSGRLKVLVVDDQARARQSLRALLVTWPLTEEVREAVNGSEAILLVEQSQPDLVLMDARMPEMDGLEATRMIKSRWPKVKIIVLSQSAAIEAFGPCCAMEEVRLQAASA